jgi:ankyrin repeat protein
MDLKTAIGNGDAKTLRTLLRERSSRANALIRWGNDDCIRTHPLHYASDLFFNKALNTQQALAIIGALIDAGADLDFQVDGKGDTPLIGATSLGAEDVGLALLDAGADSRLCGIFGETALH